MAETYTGEIRNGVEVFDPVSPWPEGTKVRVEPVDRLETVSSGSDSDPMDLASPAQPFGT